MSTPASPPTPRPQSRRRRWLLVGAFVLVLPFGLYAAAAQWLLSTESGREWIASRTADTQIRWQGARSRIPGRVHLDHLYVRGGKTPRWTVEAKAIDARLSLSALLGREVSTRWISIDTLKVSIENTEDSSRDAAPESTLRADEAPETLAAPVAAPSQEPSLEKGTPEKATPWRIHIRGAEVSHFQGLDFDQTSFTSDGPLSGTFEYQLGGDMRLEDIELRMHDATLSRSERLVAEIPVLEIRGSLAGFDPRTAEIPRVLDGLVAEIVAKARTSGIGALDDYVAKAPWLHVEGGSGTLEARVSLEGGRVQPGSSLAFDGRDIHLELLDYRISGTPTLEGRVDPDGVRLDLRIDDYGFEDPETGSPYLRGDTLSLLLTTPETALSAPPDFDVVLHLEQGRVPDFRAFNRLFSSVNAIELLGGSATLDSHLVLTTREQSPTNESVIAIQGHDVELRYEDLDVTTELTLSSRLSAVRPQQRQFDIVRIALELEEATLRQRGKPIAERWRAGFSLLDGQLTLADPLLGDARLELAMSDARPLLAVFGEGKSYMELISRVLRLTDVTGSADLSLDTDSIVLDDIRIDSEDLEIEGRLCLENEGRRGILHADVHGIGVAANLEGDWTLMNSRRWYSEQLSRVVCTPQR